jgi:UDP-3-O-[3-hydroxymyristoyl] glucosamine N-acyltransferase
MTSAYVAPGAFVAATAKVFEGAWIGPGVEIGPGATIGPGAVLGFAPPHRPASTLKIGANTFIDSGVQIRPGSDIGAEVTIEAGSFLGAETRVGSGSYLGPHCVIAGYCEIQDHVFLCSDVNVCRNARLQSHCQLMPGVKMLDDFCPPTQLDPRGPDIGQCAVIGVNAVIWSGVRIGRHALIAAGSIVKDDVPDYMLVRGAPARPVCDSRRIQVKMGDRWVYPYPWTRHLIEGEDITKPA